MASLAQFLALLANDIRRAKTLVDLDTAQQSSRFLKDDFLRLLPITRIDIDQVQLRFKMATAGITVNKNDSPFIATLNEKIKPSVEKIIKNYRVEKKLTLVTMPPDIITQSVIETLIPEISEMEPTRLGDSIKPLSSIFAQRFIEKFDKAIPNLPNENKQQISDIVREIFVEKLNEYVETYKEGLPSQFLKELGRLDVVVDGSRLKEFSPDYLVELQLYLVPKTFHWSLKPEYAQNKEAPSEDRYTLMPGS